MAWSEIKGAFETAGEMKEKTYHSLNCLLNNDETPLCKIIWCYVLTQYIVFRSWYTGFLWALCIMYHMEVQKVNHVLKTA